MTTTVDAKEFTKAMKFAAQVIERRNTIPILSTARFVFKTAALRITGSDLDMEAVATCEAQGSDKIAFCADPKKIIKFLNGASGPVTISVDGENVTITAEGSTMTLGTLPVEDFPEMSYAEMPESLEVGQKDLSDAIRSTAFCISSEETRYYLNGLYMTAHPDTVNLRFVATDGHRIGIYDIEQKAPKSSGIIPNKAIRALGRAIKASGNETVKILVGELKAEFHTPSGIIKTKMIDGTYPDYTRVIPNPSSNLRATINAAAIERVISVYGGSGGAIEFDPDKMTMKCNSIGVGSVSVPCHVHGDEKWGLNGEYLLQLCRAAGGPVQIKGSGAKDAFICTSDDTRAMWAIMPMYI